MKTIQERFDSKYEKVAGIDCWLWKAASHQFGYGHMRYMDKIEVAHRISYRLHIGEIPDGMNVLHKCDVPQCVRPDHLFIGTHKDNVDDKVNKGRAGFPKMFGVDNPAAKITKQIADAIKVDNRKIKEICSEYGISQSQVKRIRSGKSWGAK